MRRVDEAVLASADTVLITYRTQKNGKCVVTVTQHRTSAKPGTGFCPVCALAGLVSCISAYNLSTDQWEEVAARPMNLVTSRGVASAPESSSYIVWGGMAWLSGLTHWDALPQSGGRGYDGDVCGSFTVWGGMAWLSGLTHWDALPHSSRRGYGDVPGRHTGRDNSGNRGGARHSCAIFGYRSNK